MESPKSQSIWIASGNAAKVKELIFFANKYFPELQALAKEPQNVVESADSFQGNAQLKAEALALELIHQGLDDFWVLGDDSGLSVDLLQGRPGILSGRYSGFGSNSIENLQKVLSEVNELTMDLQRRTAQYRCALYGINVREGQMMNKYAAEGVRQGLIGLQPQGTQGYAYDAIFLDPQSKRSYAEFSYEEKQIDSHRDRAFAQLHRLIQADKS